LGEGQQFLFLVPRLRTPRSMLPASGEERCGRWAISPSAIFVEAEATELRAPDAPERWRNAPPSSMKTEIAISAGPH